MKWCYRIIRKRAINFMKECLIPHISGIDESSYEFAHRVFPNVFRLIGYSHKDNYTFYLRYLMKYYFVSIKET